MLAFRFDAIILLSIFLPTREIAVVSESHREDTGPSENWRLRFVRWTSTSLVIVITLLGLTGLFPPFTAGLSGAIALCSLVLAWLRKPYGASLLLVMAASAHPLYGFATETAVDRLLMEMTGLTLSFFLSAILLSRVSRFVYPACIAIGGIVLLANHSTLEPRHVQ